MAADCGFELRKKNVCCISLWPGVVRTEEFLHAKEDEAYLFDDIVTKSLVRNLCK